MLGFNEEMRLGAKALVDELQKLRSIGAHHVLFDLNGTGRSIAKVIAELSADVLPHIND